MYVDLRLSRRELEIVRLWSDSTLKSGHWGDGNALFPDESFLLDLMERMEADDGHNLHFTRNCLNLMIHWAEGHFRDKFDKIRTTNAEDRQVIDKLLESRSILAAVSQSSPPPADPHLEPPKESKIYMDLRLSSRECEIARLWSDSTLKAGHWGDGNALFPDESYVLDMLERIERGGERNLYFTRSGLNLMIQWAERHFRSKIDKIETANAEERRLIDKLIEAREKPPFSLSEGPPPGPPPPDEEKKEPEAMESEQETLPSSGPEPEQLEAKEPALETVVSDAESYRVSEEDKFQTVEDKEYRQEENGEKD